MNEIKKVVEQYLDADIRFIEHKQEFEPSQMISFRTLKAMAEMAEL